VVPVNILDISIPSVENPYFPVELEDTFDIEVEETHNYFAEVIYFAQVGCLLVTYIDLIFHRECSFQTRMTSCS